MVYTKKYYCRDCGWNYREDSYDSKGSKTEIDKKGLCRECEQEKAIKEEENG